MMLNNLCDVSTNKDEWINGCSYGETSSKWFWGWYYYNCVRVVQNSECINRYYDITTKNNHNQIFSPPSTNSLSLWAPIPKFRQHGCRNFKFICFIYWIAIIANIFSLLISVMVLPQFNFFFSLQILSLSSLLLFLRISAMTLLKFTSLLIFPNKFERYSYHK